VPFLAASPNLQSPPSGFACVGSGRGDGPNQPDDTRLTETVRLGNSSRPHTHTHTRAPPPTNPVALSGHPPPPAPPPPRRAQPQVRSSSGAARPSSGWLQPEPGRADDDDGPAPGQCPIPPTPTPRRTADGRQAATPRDDRATRVARHRHGRWVGQGRCRGVSSACSQQPTPPMPCPMLAQSQTPTTSPSVATLFKPPPPPPTLLLRKSLAFHKAQALLRSTPLSVTQFLASCTNNPPLVAAV